MSTMSAPVPSAAARFPLMMTAMLAAGPARATAAPPEILFHADLDGRFAAPTCGKPGPAPPDDAALVVALNAARSPDALVLLGGNWAGPDPFGAALLGPHAEHAAALAEIL